MQNSRSQMAINIIGRLKKKLKIKTDIELSEVLSVKPNTISTWKKRDSVDSEAIIALCDLYGFDLNEIFLDKKTALSDKSSTPLISREVQFQYVREADTASFIEILPKYNLPFITVEESRIFQVVSNNMFPFIEENSYVICERIAVEKAENNSIVVVISKQKGLFLNRIMKSYSDSDFVLKSENVFFNDVMINTSEISEIWQIRGVLSYCVDWEGKHKSINNKAIGKLPSGQKNK